MSSYKNKTNVSPSNNPEWKETSIFGLPRITSLSSLTSPTNKGGINDIGMIVIKVKSTSGAPLFSTTDLGEIEITITDILMGIENSFSMNEYDNWFNLTKRKGQKGLRVS